MSLRARIETVANIATIGGAVVVSAVLIKVYLLPAPTPRRPQVLAETGVGTSLKGRVPLGGHLKTGQSGSPQNRPVERV